MAEKRRLCEAVARESYKSGVEDTSKLLSIGVDDLSRKMENFPSLMNAVPYLAQPGRARIIQSPYE